MNDLLALFPLQLVAFPGENLNLHIFEPRYRQLIQECAETGMRFGIPAYLDKRLQDFGTLMELVSVEKTYADGKMDIRTKGIQVFRIDEFFEKAPDKRYAGGKVQYLEDNAAGDIILSDKIIKNLEELYLVMNIKKDIPAISEFNTFAMGHHVGFTIEQEYEMLQIRSEVGRQEFMLQHLEKLIPTVRQMEALRKRVQMNGHFKDLKPPF